MASETSDAVATAVTSACALLDSAKTAYIDGEAAFDANRAALHADLREQALAAAAPLPALRSDLSALSTTRAAEHARAAVVHEDLSAAANTRNRLLAVLAQSTRAADEAEVRSRYQLIASKICTGGEHCYGGFSMWSLLTCMCIRLNM